MLQHPPAAQSPCVVPVLCNVLDSRLAWVGGEHARVVDSVVDYPLEIMIRKG